jgi:hypothetical protein
MVAVPNASVNKSLLNQYAAIESHNPQGLSGVLR